MVPVGALDAPVTSAAAVPSHVEVPQGTSLRARVDPTTTLNATLVLSERNPTALTSLLRGVSDRHSPLFHDFLTRGQFDQRFAPSTQTVREVEDYLHANGFSFSYNRTRPFLLQVRGSAISQEEFFKVNLVNATTTKRSGRFHINTNPPTIPTPLATVVTAVLGLNNLPVATSFAARQYAHGHHQALRTQSRLPRGAAVTACQDAVNEASLNGGSTSDGLASYYGADPLYHLGDRGQGIRIGIPEIDALDPTDIDAFQGCFGTTATVNYFSVDGGPDSSIPSGEAALDVESTIGIAPNATVDVQFSPSSELGTYDNVSAMVNADLDNTIAISWGLCESASDNSSGSALQQVLSQAAAQGQTVIAAAGDLGSEGCDGGSDLQVDNPASQPGVIAAGGTTSGSNDEVVWNDGVGATGGGVSHWWCMPSYQSSSGIPGVLAGDSTSDSTCSTGWDREIPDISAVGDPNTGMVTYINGSWTTMGGTSLSAPLLGGMTALVDASPYCSFWGATTGANTPGLLPRGLYFMAGFSSIRGSMLYDVHSGNNDLTGTNGGLYSARYGFDMASGLGTPWLTGADGANVPNLSYPGVAASMCWYYGSKHEKISISSITPSKFAAKTPTAVTIRGSGFLPMSGADIFTINGSVSVAASCSSFSECTATIPPLGAGSYPTTMGVERIDQSTSGAGSRITVGQNSGTSPTRVSVLPVNHSTPYGKSTTFIVVVSPSTATGVITVSARGVTWCTGLPVHGSIRCTTPNRLIPSSYVVTAAFRGDATHRASSASTTFNILRTHIHSFATATPPIIRAHHSTHLVMGGFPLVAGGVVLFHHGPSIICAGRVALGTAQCLTPVALPVGVYSVLATYAGSQGVFPTTTSVTFRITS